MPWPSRKPRKTSPNWTNNVKEVVSQPEPVKTPTAPRMRQQGISQRSKDRRKWGVELKEKLSDIVWCEQCGVTGVRLDIAHRLKRTKITSHQEFLMAAKLCRPCHTGYDEFKGENPHERMYQGITKIIVERKI